MYFLDRINIDNCPHATGVYKIFAYTRDDQPIAISRFAGVDPTGLLYIGQTTKQNFAKRLGDFRAVSNPQKKSTGHSGALKYKTNATIRRVLGEGHKLYFIYEQSSSPSQREKELLNQYALQFGEPPPLNG